MPLQVTMALPRSRVLVLKTEFLSLISASFKSTMRSDANVAEEFWENSKKCLNVMNEFVFVESKFPFW
jgi:hypothetical protein